MAAATPAIQRARFDVLPARGSCPAASCAGADCAGVGFCRVFLPGALCRLRANVFPFCRASSFSSPSRSPSMTDLPSRETDPAGRFEIGQRGTALPALKPPRRTGRIAPFCLRSEKTSYRAPDTLSGRGAEHGQFAGIFGQFHPRARRFGRKRCEPSHYISVKGCGSKEPGRRAVQVEDDGLRHVFS